MRRTQGRREERGEEKAEKKTDEGRRRRRRRRRRRGGQEKKAVIQSGLAVGTEQPRCNRLVLNLSCLFCYSRPIILLCLFLL